MMPVDRAVSVTAGRCSRFALRVLFSLALASVCGCTESVRQYLELGGWTRPPDEARVLSGSPDRDSAAYAAASEELTEADWQVLERIAPRAVWQRLQKLQQGAEDEQEPAGASSEPRDILRADRLPRPPREIPIVELPGDKVQIFYELRHFGGTTSTASEDGRTERKKLSLKQADLKPLVDILSKQLEGKGVVSALPSENKIIVTCPKALQKQALSLLDSIDVPRRQVEITARIFEVSHDFDFQLGAQMLVRHMAGDNKQGLASAFSPKAFVDSVTDPLAGQVADPGSAVRLLQVFGDSGWSLDATFQALADTGLIKVVSAPRMTVSVGDPARMLAGQELPIQSAKISNDQIVTQKVTYLPIGVQLYVVPQIITEDEVKLHVVTNVSSVSGFAPLPKMGTEESAETLTNPILDSREAETYVTVGDGDTLVIGGLRMIRTVTREAKIPGLGDIELMEWLFKNHRSQKLVNDLYFFVTPRIIRRDAS